MSRPVTSHPMALCHTLSQTHRPDLGVQLCHILIECSIPLGHYTHTWICTDFQGWCALWEQDRENKPNDKTDFIVQTSTLRLSCMVSPNVALLDKMRNRQTACTTFS